MKSYQANFNTTNPVCEKLMIVGIKYELSEICPDSSYLLIANTKSRGGKIRMPVI